MKTVTIAHQKGGVGKSTIAMNLAYALIEQGYDVALMDVDLQSTTWSCAKGVKIYSEGEKINKHDFLIVDTPPFNKSTIPELFYSSELVIIPTTVGIPELIAMQATVEAFLKAQKKKRKIIGAILFNRVESSSVFLRQLRPHFEKFDLPILETQINKRIAFRRSIASERGVFSTEDVKAQSEINELVFEILKLMKYD